MAAVNALAPPARVRPSLPSSLVNQAERARADLAGYGSISLPDRAQVADRTEGQRTNIMVMWKMFAKTDLGIDPDEIWLDLCRGKEGAIPYLQSFLKAYVDCSYEQRVCLGPEEYEYKRTVTTGVSMMEVWKNLWVRSTFTDELQLGRDQTFKKVPATAEDITLYLDTLWRRAEDIPCSPSIRIAFHAVMLLSAVGGFRPGTLMELPYRQIQLVVVRDPLEKTKTRLVANITIFQNKQDGNRLGRKQDHMVSFSITIVPWPLLCIVGLIVTTALREDAFETRCQTLEDILNRPILQDVDCVPLNWKKDIADKPIFGIKYHAFYDLWYKVLLVAGIRDPPRPYSLRVGAGGRLHKCLENHLSNYILSHTTPVFQESYQPVHVAENLPMLAFAGVLQVDAQKRLYSLLANSSLQRDENAPIYPTKEDLDEWERRTDIQGLRFEYRTAKGSFGTDHANAKRIAAQIQAIRDRLSELTVERDRKVYFEAVDKLRAAGSPIPSHLVRNNKVLRALRKQYHETSSEAAAAIGRFLHQENHVLGMSIVSFVEMGTAYLGGLPGLAHKIADSYSNGILEPPPKLETPALIIDDNSVT
ncbi:hypothetical protein CPLU01_12565 [Colletotrichum plurivorum]|uniref:Uncharacterized protein n=1 Tax=Colletotrichum plurivorum TaxID=2175906 RepID=A0A8H6JYQ4_9PEZI|nr:hypothetical protein CPLU01_12565 [Colletotrichum plurivorum]